MQGLHTPKTSDGIGKIAIVLAFSRSIIRCSICRMQHAGGSGALSSCAMSCQEQLPPEDSEQEEMEDLEDLELEELEELDPL